MYEDKIEIIYAKHDDGSYSRREKHYDSNGVVVAVVDIGDVDSGTPITKEEYEQLRKERGEKILAEFEAFQKQSAAEFAEQNAKDFKILAEKFGEEIASAMFRVGGKPLPQ